MKEKSTVFIAISEGIRLADGTYVSEAGGGSDYVDAFGHKQLTGSATYLANLINHEIGCKTRAVEFSSLQRSASHLASRVDINEAFMVGGAAVKAADEGIPARWWLSTVSLTILISPQPASMTCIKLPMARRPCQGNGLRNGAIM